MSSVGHYEAFNNEPNIKMENDYATKPMVERKASQLENQQTEMIVALERLQKTVHDLEEKLTPVMIGPYPTDAPSPPTDCEELTPAAQHLATSTDTINHMTNCIQSFMDRAKI